jgi:hypothetical protein
MQTSIARNSGNTAAEMLQSETQVQTKVFELRKAASEVKEAAEKIQLRLAPVLRTPEPLPTSPTQCPKMVLVPLADDLGQIQLDIQNTAEQLNAIRSWIEL